MFISREKIKELEGDISLLRREVAALKEQIREIPDSGYTVYEDSGLSDVFRSWLSLESKKYSASQMFDLIFDKLGVRPKYVPGSDPRIELAKLAPNKK